MGLAASQARLLSLSSRQKRVEYDAQRLMSQKMQLSNDSDKAFQVYQDALNDTRLQTKQFNHKTGASAWINGSLNNLLRYDTADHTSGSVFYVQDMRTGKLHIPQVIGEKYNLATDARNFAEQFGITYTRVDHNEDILIRYNEAIEKGWDTKLTEADLVAYQTAIAKDASAVNLASLMLDFLPTKNGDGTFSVMSWQEASGGNYIDNIVKVIGREDYETIYTAAERAILEESYNLFGKLDLIYPEDTETVKNNSEYGSLGDYTETVKYIPTELSATSGSNEYVSNTKDLKFTVNDRYMMMLNGGTLTYTGVKITTQDYHNDYYYVTCGNGGAAIELETKSEENDHTFTKDIYDSNTNNLLRNYNGGTYSTIGQALEAIFTRVINENTGAYTNAFLASKNITVDDVNNFIEYQARKSEREGYVPNIEYVPSDTVKGPYYENMYNAITAAGGWIGAGDGRANNATWVQNMIKNAEVILTTWDIENNMLSKTSSALNTDIQEVADNSKIEKASQDYEAAMADINHKDTNIDTRLQTLETEKNALETEIETLENVVKDNIKKNFQLYS